MSIATEVKILDILDNVGGYGTGQTIVFKHNGKKLRYESWATEDGSGTDFYDMEGHPVGIAYADDESEFEDDESETELGEFFDSVLVHYHEQYQRWVNPALEQAVAETLIQVQRLQEGLEDDEAQIRRHEP